MKKFGAIGLTLILAMLAILLVAAVFFYKSHFNKSMQLQDAAEAGDLQSVKSLIQEGVLINQTSSIRFGWTPLIGAIFQNQTNVIYYLVESGADVNLADKNGVTPLMWVAMRHDEGVPLITYLIDHGANLDAKDKLGATVFDVAKGYPPAPKLIKALETAKIAQDSKATNNSSERTNNTPQKP